MLPIIQGPFANSIELKLSAKGVESVGIFSVEPNEADPYGFIFQRWEDWEGQPRIRESVQIKLDEEARKRLIEILSGFPVRRAERLAQLAARDVTNERGGGEGKVRDGEST